MRKIITLHLLLLLFTQAANAQKKLILEKFRCYNVNNPVLNYLKSSDIRKTIAAQLYQALQKHRQLSMTDTSDFALELLDFNYVVPVIRPEFTNPDTSTLHLYLDFIEVDPFYFFRPTENTPADSTLLQRTKTVFILQAQFFGADRILRSRELLNIAVTAASTTPGIGNLYNNGIQYTDLTVTPKTFTRLLRTAVDLLFNPANEMALVEMQLQPAYHADNYLLPKTIKQPRIYVSENKKINTYQFNNNIEMIRMGETKYEEIRIKGKKAEKYPDKITAAIKSSSNFSRSDFVFLNQEGRDVLRDRNYLIKLTTQIDPDNIPEERNLLFTNFLSGNFHFLLHEKDTLARFVILKQVSDRVNKFYPNIITNGYDSSTFYPLPVSISRNNEWPVVYNYIINGTLAGSPFQLKCSGSENTIKEFFWENKLVCIAQGKFSPEKFVIFDASLSAETLNQLFMIGFNRFLE